MTKTENAPKIGTTIHFLRSGVGFHNIVTRLHVGSVSRRGQELQVTEELLEANKDRNGNLPAWLLLAADPEAQRQAFGHEILGIGPWPADLLKTVPGEFEHEEARRREISEAEVLHDEKERKAALRAIEDAYGPAPSSNGFPTVYGGVS